MQPMTMRPMCRFRFEIAAGVGRAVGTPLAAAGSDPANGPAKDSPQRMHAIRRDLDAGCGRGIEALQYGHETVESLMQFP
jgi:hypothetical protein